jgi:chromosome segregation ATPase
MSRIYGLLMMLVLSSTILTSNAWSQDDRASRERIALRRAQQQVQQALQEKTALEEKVHGIEQEKEKLAGQIDGAQAHAKAESAKNQRLQLSIDTITQEKQTLLAQKVELDQRLAELTAKHAGAERELAQSQATNKQLQSTLSKREQQVASCEDKNVKLYQYGRDLIGQCRDHSATDAVLRLEPFTGIKRVEIENLLEEYRDKLDTQKLSSTEDRK